MHLWRGVWREVSKIVYPVGRKLSGSAGSFQIYEGEVTFRVVVARKKENVTPLEINVLVHAANDKRNLLPSVIKAKVP
jgi:hypothetical protein